MTQDELAEAIERAVAGFSSLQRRGRRARPSSSSTKAS